MYNLHCILSKRGRCFYSRCTIIISLEPSTFNYVKRVVNCKDHSIILALFVYICMIFDPPAHTLWYLSTQHSQTIVLWTNMALSYILTSTLHSLGTIWSDKEPCYFILLDVDLCSFRAFLHCQRIVLAKSFVNEIFFCSKAIWKLNLKFNLRDNILYQQVASKLMKIIMIKTVTAVNNLPPCCCGNTWYWSLMML